MLRKTAKNILWINKMNQYHSDSKNFQQEPTREYYYSYGNPNPFVIQLSVYIDSGSV